MHQSLNEKISVLATYDQVSGTAMPRKLKWRDRYYTITKLGYYHRVRVGRNIMHIFHVTDGTLDFRLRLDSENLHWTLEEVTDGYG